MSIRKSVVSGSFYPNNDEDIKKYIKKFQNQNNIQETLKEVRAIIVPHAGYLYSGYTANLAYEVASNFLFQRIVVIGPSHQVYLKGASVSLYDEYETPLGNIEIDLNFSKKLIEKYDFLDFNKDCEFEHSTETQAPFIKNYFNNSKMVEIIYGDCTYIELSTLISDLLKDKDTLVVISSDLSHFYTQEEACILDTFCLEAIEKKDLNLFEHCEACGKLGLKAIVDVAIKKDLKTKNLYYCTSSDYSNNKSRVVGYTSALIGK